MSVETDFRAALAAHAPLVALVATRISQDSVAEGSDYPLVVFGVNHNRILGLNNALLSDQCAIAVQCWGETAASAAAVADAVIAAIAASATAITAGSVVTERATTADPEMGLDGVLLSVEWWA